MLQFNRDDTLICALLDGSTAEERHGTWELSGDTATIFWDDGETDWIDLSPEDPNTITVGSTGEILDSWLQF